jgi:2-keto-4-pentenoate hydratase
MDSEHLRGLADTLAHNRIAGIVSSLSLAEIRDSDEAAAIQSVAVAALADDSVGYTIVGSSAAARRGMGLEAPIFGVLTAGAVRREQPARFRLPQGFVGAQCELVFTLGPLADDCAPYDRARVAAAVLGCRPAIGLLGRRTAAPPSRLGALADYALHVATICGPYCRNPAECDLAGVVVSARIDGHEVARAPMRDVMGDPLNAVAWLAAALRADGGGLNAGDLVATGSCTPILQVLPGQRLEVDFGPAGQVACAFV